MVASQARAGLNYSLLCSWKPAALSVIRLLCLCKHQSGRVLAWLAQSVWSLLHLLGLWPASWPFDASLATDFKQAAGPAALPAWPACCN